MDHFELVCILKPDLTKQDQKKVNDIMVKSVSDSGGKVIDQEVWGIKDLAYPIKKSKKGFYIFLQIDINSSKVASINNVLKLNEDIIRHLAVKVDSHEKLPSIMNR